jgi:hypothetical protein
MVDRLDVDRIRCRGPIFDDYESCDVIGDEDSVDNIYIADLRFGVDALDRIETEATTDATLEAEFVLDDDARCTLPEESTADLECQVPSVF